jgi:pyruvate/2-oxoglutarate dehydrogenase complex dihydrolipoamide dehydrogenase (E3) component
MPPSTESFDALVLGAGQAGTPLAKALAKAGRKTALIERDQIGGTCVNVGCTPTKTMIASARVAYLARRAGDYGIRTGSPTVDLARVRERKRAIVASFRGGSERGVRETSNLEWVRGDASFVGPDTVAVALPDAQRHLRAPIIVINTGCRPTVPSLPGLDRVPFLDSTSIMELDTLPEKLLVLGGGYIGLEFGQMFRRFGSRVAIVQRSAHLLTREDDDVADEVAKILREDGIELFLGANALRVGGAAGRIELTIRAPEGEQVVEGSHLLIGVGRSPNTERLNLATAGVAIDPRGFIQVDEQLRTSVPGVYAAGDVNGGPAFTHISYDDFRLLRTNLIDGGSASTAGRLVPYTVFLDPQLGRVGLTEEQARAQGRKIKVAKMPMSYVARALEVDEPRGFMKAVVDAETDQILGGAILGIEGGEIMSLMQVAMMGGLAYTKLRDCVFAHPTLAEGLNNLFSSMN